MEKYNVINVFIIFVDQTNTDVIRKEPEDDIDEPEPDTTLFIKNINFSTTEENITKVI